MTTGLANIPETFTRCFIVFHPLNLNKGQTVTFQLLCEGKPSFRWTSNFADADLVTARESKPPPEPIPGLAAMIASGGGGALAAKHLLDHLPVHGREWWIPILVVACIYAFFRAFSYWIRT